MPGNTLTLRGTPGGGDGWSVCRLRGDRLTGVPAVDRARDLAQARRLITAATPVDPGRIADPDAPLKTAARAAVGEAVGAV
ncbi:oxidoreductase C-terminal domain-containing protein [Streptomyces sp. 900105755]